ncbi:MAG: DMT family transporter [Betaproteobacteria bacterium]|nr:DMT family transporter [Betaproteobacteria bacterium]MCC6250028.1 DMT family transporter [Rubrivivax sp.]MCL4696661.1 DMT family transporter [Burkholderiaceae bacterium]
MSAPHVKSHHPWWAQVLLFLVPALWSSNYLIARLGAEVIHPNALAFGRWALAFALLLPFVGGGLLAKLPVVRREWQHLLVLGALGMWICGAWVYIAGRTTSAANIALIYAAAPVAIAIAGVKVLHERMGRLQWAAMASALAGVLFVIARGDVHNLLALRLAPGDLWIVATTAAWTAYSVLLKLWPSALGPGERLAAIIAGGLVWLLPATVWEAMTAPPLPFTTQSLFLIALAAVLPGVLSYGAYSLLQRELGAARTALMQYLAPVYGALGAWWVLGEVPHWYHGVGAALILPSIWLATRRVAVR